MASSRSRETLFSALCASIAAAFLFFVALGSDSDGILLIFLPCFPLLLLGLAMGARQASIACTGATLMVLLLTGPAGAIFFTGFIALPAYYFVQQSLLWRDESNKERRWYSILKLLSELTIIVAATCMIIALANASDGGLKSLVPPSLADSFKGTDPDFEASVRQFTGPLSFALFACLGWLWILALYGFALLANRLLKAKSLNLRPGLAIDPQGLPAWLLGLAILSGGFSLAGQGLDRYTAETIFLLLLLPYLLSGLAYVHTVSFRRHFAFRRAWLACFYIVLVCTRWPVLAVIAIGLYLQLAEMLDRRNKIG